MKYLKLYESFFGSGTQMLDANVLRDITLNISDRGFDIDYDNRNEPYSFDICISRINPNTETMDTFLNFIYDNDLHESIVFMVNYLIDYGFDLESIRYMKEDYKPKDYYPHFNIIIDAKTGDKIRTPTNNYIEFLNRLIGQEIIQVKMKFGK